MTPHNALVRTAMSALVDNGQKRNFRLCASDPT